MTKKQLDITSLSVALAGAILAYGDKWVAIPGLPGWLVNSWPLVIFAATLIDRVGNIVLKSSTPIEQPVTPPINVQLAPITRPTQP